MPKDQPCVLSVRLTQAGDTCSSDVCQYLTLKIDDGGAGAFAVLKTKRWSITNGDDLRQLADRIDRMIAEYDESFGYQSGSNSKEKDTLCDG